MTTQALGREDQLTFKANLRNTRFGWLRLTPAYSVHLVSDLLARADATSNVLDPFCGTGTTALVCAEHGVPCDTTDINPFLIWLTEAKTYAYEPSDIECFVECAAQVQAAFSNDNASEWLPPLHQIEKWWDSETVHALGHGAARIGELADSLSVKVIDLLQVAFCRTLIDRANVSFGHQSMSFKRKSPANPTLFVTPARDLLVETWQRSIAGIAGAATSPIRRQPKALLCDARNLTAALPRAHYDLVITSPPYPNRMSYIRELRPYMYWLGFLSDGREAGELDWTAIGGTWGSATSNLMRWAPEADADVPYDDFSTILGAIAERSPLLSRYVEKYFHDMVRHCTELFQVVAPGGLIHYIVGNSKFYDVLIPVERIYAGLFDAAGFVDTTVQVIRKRSSKKELFEYIVSARKPN